MDFFNDHAVLFALAVRRRRRRVRHVPDAAGCSGSRPATSGCRRSPRAIQEGAAAYLARQYTTIAIVAVVPFLADRLLHELGWGTAIGFLIGAVLSARGRLHRHERLGARQRAHRRGRHAAALAPALDVAFRAGAVTGMLVVGLGLLGVAGYYWVLTGWLDNSPKSADRRPGRPRLRRLADLDLRASRRRHLHQGRRRRRRPRRQGRGRHPRGRPAQPGGDRRQRRRQRRRLRRHGRRPVRDLRGDRGRHDAARRALLHRRRAALVLSTRSRSAASRSSPRSSAPSSSRVGDGEHDHERALQGPDRRRPCSRRSAFYPGHDWLFDGSTGRLGFGELVLFCAASSASSSPACSSAITEYYTGTGYRPVQVDRQGLADRPRAPTSSGPRRRHAGDRAAGARDRRRHPRRLSARRPLRHRRRGDGAAVAWPA